MDNARYVPIYLALFRILSFTKICAATEDLYLVPTVA